MAGAILLHVPSVGADLSTVPASNITVTTNAAGGVTTSYLLPASELPLVTLIPMLKSSEAMLKTIVDSGYARNDRQGIAAASVTTAISAADGSASHPVDGSETAPLDEPEAASTAAGLSAQVGDTAGPESDSDDQAVPTLDPDSEAPSVGATRARARHTAATTDNGREPQADRTSGTRQAAAPARGSRQPAS